MEVHTIDVKEGSLAKTTIEFVAKAIESYISPVGMLGENSSLIAGNSDASIRLINNHIQGWANLIRNAVRELPNYYLKHNGYTESWHAEINIPSTAIEDTANNLSKAQLLASTKTGTVNEIRELMGLEGVSAEEIAKMQKEWNLIPVSSVQVADAGEPATLQRTGPFLLFCLRFFQRFVMERGLARMRGSGDLGGLKRDCGKEGFTDYKYSMLNTELPNKIKSEKNNYNSSILLNIVTFRCESTQNPLKGLLTYYCY